MVSNQRKLVIVFICLQYTVLHCNDALFTYDVTFNFTNTHSGATFLASGVFFYVPSKDLPSIHVRSLGVAMCTTKFDKVNANIEILVV